MSSLGNVVRGKLALKGKPLDVKDGVKKKKKKSSQLRAQQLQALQQAQEALKQEEERNKTGEDKMKEGEEGEENEQGSPREDYRTAAEKRYQEQIDKIERNRASKLAGKSHRERIEEFNQYLANMSEHYDIPKVGPG